MTFDEWIETAEARKAFADRAKTVEPNWDLVLNQFWCKYHKQVFIVHRELHLLILSCGCAYMVGDAYGIKWINTTAPAIDKGKE